MSEPHLPLPADEQNPYWNADPMRCSVPGCRNILATVNPASIRDALEGVCAEHGRVKAIEDSRTFGNPEGGE